MARPLLSLRHQTLSLTYLPTHALALIRKSASQQLATNGSPESRNGAIVAALNERDKESTTILCKPHADWVTKSLFVMQQTDTRIHKIGYSPSSCDQGVLEIDVVSCALVRNKHNDSFSTPQRLRRQSVSLILLANTFQSRIYQSTMVYSVVNAPLCRSISSGYELAWHLNISIVKLPWKS